jgi:hypothetical protein
MALSPSHRLQVTQDFMETEGSLPFWQESSNPLCHINPVYFTQTLSLSSILTLSSHQRLGLTNGLFLSDFSTKILYACEPG